MRKCSAKSDFLQCLNDIVKQSLSPPNVEVKIIDVSALVNINKPKTLETFGQYCSQELPRKVKQQLGSLKQLDFLFDTYNYLNVYVSLLKRPYPLTFPTFQYIQLTKNTLHIFLNVTIKPGSSLRCKHTQGSVKTVNLSAD